MRKKIMQPVVSMLIILMLTVPTITYAKQADTPPRTLLYGTYSALELWGSFMLLAAGPNFAITNLTPLVSIEDENGVFVAEAVWDGKGPKVLANGRAWSMNLSAEIEDQRVDYELESAWDDNSKLANGTITLVLRETSGLGVSHRYIHKLKLAGFAGSFLETSAEAVLSFPSASDGELSDFIIIVASENSCEFIHGLLNVSDIVINTIEASSSTNSVKSTDQSLILSFSMILLKTWSSEPTLSLAKAMHSASVSPDLRIIGFTDRETVNPGDDIEYTYYLFNAGMEEAIDVEVNIPVPEGTELVPSSLSCTDGEVRLIPSEEVIDLSGAGEVTHLAGKGITSMIWTPGRPLLPGGTFTVSFKVII